METNMEHVREVAKALLFTDIHETKFSPMIVQHPFTSSGIVGLPTADGVELVNICESHKQLERWQDFTTAQIDECDSPLKVYMLINKPYDLERWKKVVTENIWLHYFNNVLLEKELITRVEWVRMSALINTRYPTSKPRVR